MAGKKAQPKVEKIISLNPDFTKLLSEQSVDGLVSRMHPLYVSADDPLPPYVYTTPQDWMYRPEPAPDYEELVLEADEIQHPDDTNPKGWPARNAEPTQLAITGSIPITEL